jgi:hypothetical protein
MINPDALRRPEGELLLTFVKEGKTIAFVIDPQLVNLDTNQLELHGTVCASNFLTGIDKRLDVQRRSIERQLVHLKHHCPALQGTGECDHIGGETND